VTIFLTAEEKKAYDEMKKKNTPTQLIKLPMPMPMPWPTIMPMPMNIPSNMQPVNGFNVPFQGGQFPQPSMYRQPQKPMPQPRNN
jgi:hypothetical protein